LFYLNLRSVSGIALSQTSDFEIKEMLKQIDAMINQKKLKWERQRQEMDARIQSHEHEAQMHANAIEQKNLEVSQ